MSYYAPDATAYPQGMPKVTGPQAIRDEWTKMMSMPGSSLRWIPEKAEVDAAGDLGYTTGTYTMTMNNAAGNTVTENGKYVAVWKKQSDGQWKPGSFAFDHERLDP